MDKNLINKNYENNIETKDTLLSVIVPCFNEINTLEKVIDKIKKSPIKEKEIIIKKEFKNSIPIITRFKGLGEMRAEQLKHTTMHISKRKLINVNLNKGKKEIKLTDKLFEQLMGKKPEFRFKFIQDNANFIRQIDT